MDGLSEVGYETQLSHNIQGRLLAASCQRRGMRLRSRTTCRSSSCEQAVRVVAWDVQTLRMHVPARQGVLYTPQTSRWLSSVRWSTHAASHDSQLQYTNLGCREGSISWCGKAHCKLQPPGQQQLPWQSRTQGALKPLAVLHCCLPHTGLASGSKRGSCSRTSHASTIDQPVAGGQCRSRLAEGEAVSHAAP